MVSNYRIPAPEVGKTPYSPFRALNQDCSLADGLVCFFPMSFSPDNGETLIDVSGNGYHAPRVGGTARKVISSTGGENIKKPVLNASTGYYETTDALPSGAFNDGSLAFWVKRSSQATNAVIGCSSQTSRFFYARNGSSSLSFWDGGSRWDSSSTWTVNEWRLSYCRLASVNNSVSHVWLSSPSTTEMLQETTSTAKNFGNGKLVINNAGSYSYTNTCEIGPIMMWDRFLDEDEIQDMYQPSTRFKLWGPTSYKTYSFPAAAPGGTVSANRMTRGIYRGVGRGMP